MEGRRNRTRGQWEVYYKQLHRELKQQQRKREKSGGAVDVEALIKEVKKEIVDGDEALREIGVGVGDDDDEEERNSVEDVVVDDDVDVNSVEFGGESCEKGRDGGGVEKQRNDECVDLSKDDVDGEKERNVHNVDVEMDVDDDNCVNLSEDDGGESDGVEIVKKKENDGDDDEAESGDSSEGDGNSRMEGDGSVDSGSCSEEDSDESVSESESEPTSEEDDELFDEDYERSESSISGSSDDSEEEEGEDDEDDENENVVNRAKGRKGVGTIGESRRESDEGSGDCEIRSREESDCEMTIGNVDEKLIVCRKRRRTNAEKESRDELETGDENENAVNRAKGRKSVGTNGESRRESGEGSSDCEIRSSEESDCIMTIGNVDEKLVVSRKRRMNTEKESRDELEMGDEKETEKETEKKGKVSKAKKNSTDYANDEDGDDECSIENATGGKRRSHSARGSLIKILVDTMDLFKEKQYSIDENALAENTLPLRFRFEDEVEPPPPVKSEWELHIDSLFCDMELGIREIEADCMNPYTVHTL